MNGCLSFYRSMVRYENIFLRLFGTNDFSERPNCKYNNRHKKKTLTAAWSTLYAIIQFAIRP